MSYQMWPGFLCLQHHIAAYFLIRLENFLASSGSSNRLNAPTIEVKFSTLTSLYSVRSVWTWTSVKFLAATTVSWPAGAAFPTAWVHSSRPHSSTRLTVTVESLTFVGTRGFRKKLYSLKSMCGPDSSIGCSLIHVSTSNTWSIGHR